MEMIGGLRKAFLHEDGSEKDGIVFERAYETMAARFKNAYDGVRHDDVEFALAAEAAGKLELLNAILSRQTHVEDFKC